MAGRRRTRENASRKKMTLRFKQESTKYLLKSESVEFERFEMPFFNAVFNWGH